MKIEDIKYDFSGIKPVDEKNWNKEQWLKENPIDYYKMIYVLNQADSGVAQTEVFKTLYQIVRLYIPQVLFKYCSLSDNETSNEKRFKTLLEQKIFMADIKSFNDPFDSKGFFYKSEVLADIDRLQHVNGKLIDDFTSFIKATSLSANGVQSMPMWAHYSNNHSGYCVSYDMNDNILLSGCTFPVQYTNKRLDISSFMLEQAEQISKKIDYNIQHGIKETKIHNLLMIYMPLLLYNLKHESWSYENEFRCTTAANAEGMPYIKAIPKEIYIGMNCSDKNTHQLVEIGKTLNVPVYKMFFDDYDPQYQLKSRKMN